jgi:hypothetical protein
MQLRSVGRPVFGILVVLVWTVPGLCGQDAMPDSRSADAAAPDAAAVCISNPTDVAIRYRHRWEFEQEWGDVETLEAGKNRWYWWRFEPGEEPVSPDFFIVYDDHFDKGYTARTYVLDRYPITLPGSCDAARKYWFSIEGRTIQLYSVN